ncbi:PAS domain-containing sensor histidine kinase [Leptothrix discophora]|uniref:PAS domain S-box protein n=1 Tax=Leptothrix discophora TaxID=89 RepID=A0ABT9G2K6_LEPDI|nr:PAS domain S-box protein [Leptothrix discophora]MDP4300719.1 PAS domain S-box protein [Leptothrix discophora]
MSDYPDHDELACLPLIDRIGRQIDHLRGVRSHTRSIRRRADDSSSPLLEELLHASRATLHAQGLEITSLRAALARCQQRRQHEHGAVTEPVDDREAEDLLFLAHPQALLVVDVETRRILDANPAACEQYGWRGEDWRGLGLADLHTGPEHARMDAYLDRLGRGMPASGGLWQHRRADGSPFYVHLRSRPLRRQGREARLMLVRDVSEWLATVSAREQALQALGRSESKLQAAQVLARIGSFEHDVRSGDFQCSPQLLRMLGGRPLDGRLTMVDMLTALDPRDRPQLIALRDGVLDGRAGQIVVRCPCRAGTRQAQWHAIRVEPETDRNGQVIRVHGTVQDVTESQLAAQELADLSAQLRELSAQSEQRLDQLRKRMAADLHDGLGQVLSTIKLRAQMLGQAGAASEPQRLAERVEAVGALVDEALCMVRDFSTLMRPPALALGLVSAIGWLADEFRLRAELPCEVVVDDPDGRCGGLDEDATQDLFRIVQESLGNVTRHAAAHQVGLSLAADAAGLCIEVVDDGIGFDPAQRRRHGHFGLFGMQERALRLGARLQVSSQPGRGCRVRLEMAWPVRAAPAERLPGASS